MSNKEDRLSPQKSLPTWPIFPVGTYVELYFGYSSISQLLLFHIHYKFTLTLSTLSTK